VHHAYVPIAVEFELDLVDVLYTVSWRAVRP
jgi:hypothetical protein